MSVKYSGKSGNEEVCCVVTRAVQYTDVPSHHIRPQIPSLPIAYECIIYSGTWFILAWFQITTCHVSMGKGGGGGEVNRLGNAWWGSCEAQNL